jgi:hypothetical protein
MVGYLTKSATTRLMKKILRESYPGIEFTVRAHKCGICIESTDGRECQDFCVRGAG